MLVQQTLTNFVSNASRNLSIAPIYDSLNTVDTRSSFSRIKLNLEDEPSTGSEAVTVAGKESSASDRRGEMGSSSPRVADNLSKCSEGGRGLFDSSVGSLQSWVPPLSPLPSSELFSFVSVHAFPLQSSMSTRRGSWLVFCRSSLLRPYSARTAFW